VSDALESKRDECDIEDLFNRDTFLQLVDESGDLSQALLLNERKFRELSNRLKIPSRQTRNIL
jgi:CRP-like cAMP-binding protein